MYIPPIRQQTISLLKATRLLAEELNVASSSAAAILAGAILDGYLTAKFHNKKVIPHPVGSGGYVIDLEKVEVIPVQESPCALRNLKAAVNKDEFHESVWELIDIEREDLKSCCEFRGWRLPIFWFQELPLEEGKVFSDEAERDNGEYFGRKRSDALAQEIELVIRRAGGEAPDSAIISLLRARAGKKDSCIKRELPNCLVWDRGSGKEEPITITALMKRLSRRNKAMRQLLSANQVK